MNIVTDGFIRFVIQDYLSASDLEVQMAGLQILGSDDLRLSKLLANDAKLKEELISKMLALKSHAVDPDLAFATLLRLEAMYYYVLEYPQFSASQLEFARLVYGMSLSKSVEDRKKVAQALPHLLVESVQGIKAVIVAKLLADSEDAVISSILDFLEASFTYPPRPVDIAKSFKYIFFWRLCGSFKRTLGKCTP